MRHSLIAIAACGMMTGACSLRSPEGGGSYSMLQTGPQVSAPAAPASAPEDVAAVSPRMPGDLTHPIVERSGNGVDPIAALGSSARARTHWEPLRPKDMNAPRPTLSAMSPVDASTPSAFSAAPAAPKTDGVNTYDREAKMQGLINGGRAAGRGICSGC